MISKLILTVFFFHMATSVYGQEFYDSLHKEADRTYNCSFDYYSVDSLNQVFFDSKNVRILIDSSAKYQVLFSDMKSWCSGPNCLYQLLDTVIKAKEIRDEGGLDQFYIPRKKHYHCSKTYEGIELIKNKEINFKDTVFNNFPHVQNNSDKYNNKWTIFSNEKYLILRLVSVYIGNSSSYSEKLIYFKKVE